MGIVYCLSNPEMPRLVKIGRISGDDSSALKVRMSQLYTTGVPVPFELEYAVCVQNANEAEELLHAAFSGVRDNKHREFFAIDAESVIAAMKLTGGEEIRVDDESAAGDDNVGEADIEARTRARQRLNKRLSNFKFSDAKIHSGAELSYIYDDTVKATVIGGNRIKFEGKETSLSGATQMLFARAGRWSERATRSVAGPRYWMYEGETVSRRRARLEDEAAEESSDDAD